MDINIYMERERERERKRENSSSTSGGATANNEKVSYFQMPLHYPRYTKKEYQDMPEGLLDRLLAEYGLSPHGDLAYKRAFAMGAFLWPTSSSSSSSSSNFKPLHPLSQPHDSCGSCQGLH